MQAELARLFRRQHGVAADWQLRRLGISWERQQGMVRRGIWVRPAPGIVAVAGAPQTWEQRAMAATLCIDGLVLLDGQSAARLHRLDGFSAADGIAIVVPHERRVHVATEVAVSWSRRLSSKDRHVIGGIAVTMLPLTLIRLAAMGCNPEQALDSALRQHKPPLWLRQHFERWKGPGVAGPPTMLHLLGDRMGQRLPRSWFQRLAKRALHEHGIVLVDEWPVRGPDGRLIAELDLADVELKIGIECQSIDYHATAADFAADIRRKRTLRRLGWEIVELWWTDLDRMDEVLLDLGAVVAGRNR